MTVARRCKNLPLLGGLLALGLLAVAPDMARAGEPADVAAALGALRAAPADGSAALEARLAIALAEERVLAGDYGRAHGLLAETAGALPRGTVARAAVEDALASVLDAEGRIEERVRALTAARDSLADALGRNHPDVVRARLETAHAMIAASEFAESGGSLMTIARHELEQLEADVAENLGRNHELGRDTGLTLAALDLSGNDQRAAGYRLDAYLASTERLARHSADDISDEADTKALELHDRLDTSHACRAVAALEAARERSHAAPVLPTAATPVPRSTRPLAGKGGKGPARIEVAAAPFASPETPAPGTWLDVAFCIAPDGGVRHPSVIRSGGGADAELLAGLLARRYQPRDGGACIARHERLALGTPAESGVPQQSILSRIVDGELLDGRRAPFLPRLLTDG